MGVTMMTTTMDIRSSVVDALQAGVTVKDRGDRRLVRLPLALADGHLVQVEATQVSGDVWTLSDRGQAATALWTEGIDLTTGAPARSWTALLRTLELPPAVGEPVDPFVLTMSTDSQSLGFDVVRLAEAVLLADGLRALKRSPRRAQLRGRIIAVAQELPDVGVLPGAKMRTKFGVDREVTVKLVNNTTHRELFTQGVGGAKSASYDHARALFTDASVSSDRCVVVVGADAGLEAWQRQALGTVASVVDEDDMARAFTEMLAA